MSSRKSSSKFTAWSNPQYLSFGGFDHFERKGNAIDGKLNFGRAVYPRSSILDDKLSRVKDKLVKLEPYVDPMDTNCRSPSFRLDGQNLMDKNFITRHNDSNHMQFKQQSAKLLGSLSGANKNQMKKNLKLNPSVNSPMWNMSSHKEMQMSPAGKYRTMGRPTSLNRSKMIMSPMSHCVSKHGFDVLSKREIRSGIGKRVDLHNRDQMAVLLKKSASTKVLNKHRFPWVNTEKVIQVDTLSEFIVSPMEICFQDVQVDTTYQFPLKVRNIGRKADRFRVVGLQYVSSGFEPAKEAVCLYDINRTHLAPGLHAEMVVQVQFSSKGSIEGTLVIETRAGTMEIAILGYVE